MSKRVAIIGSRSYPQLRQVRQYVRRLPRGTVVVSGGARGVDRAAEVAAQESGLGTDIYLPDWTRYGKRAGFLRNQHIVDACDEVVAFWDGKSKGTLSTIDLARKAGKPVTIYGPENSRERPRRGAKALPDVRKRTPRKHRTSRLPLGV